MSAPAEARREPEIGWARIVFGYLGAVTGAVLSLMTIAATIRIDAGALISGSSPNLGNWDIAIFLISGGVLWILGFFTAFLPFIVACAIALRFKIRSIVFYITCGVLTAVILAPVFNAIRPIEVDEEPMFLRDWVSALPLLIPICVVGALVFWYVAGRHIGGATSRTPPTQYRRQPTLPGAL
jgi:hypothetical protein